MNPDFEYFVKLGVPIAVRELLLEANLPVIIELERKQDMVSWLNLQVVTLVKWMQHPFEPVGVSNHPTLFLAEADHADAIFVKYHEIIGLEQEAFDRTLPETV